MDMEYKTDEERLELIIQCDIIQAIKDGFNGQEVKKELILKDVNWLIGLALKVDKLENGIKLAIAQLEESESIPFGLDALKEAMK
jgi:hypothetical protein